MVIIIFVLISCRNQDGYEYNAFSDEEMEEENDVYADNTAKAVEKKRVGRTLIRDSYERSNEESSQESVETSEATSYSTPAVESGVDEEEILARDSDSSYDSEPNEVDPTSRYDAREGIIN